MKGEEAKLHEGFLLLLVLDAPLLVSLGALRGLLYEVTVRYPATTT